MPWVGRAVRIKVIHQGGPMRTYFFDLDGTLCDSRPGLKHSFRAAFRALKIRVGEERVEARRMGASLPKISRRMSRAARGRMANWILGAPLPSVFRRFVHGLSDEAMEIGIAAFRAAYEDVGIRQTPLYPGARDLLVHLKDIAAPVWLVTQKPEPYAIRVLDNLGISGYFDGVVGAGLDERQTKKDLVAEALRQSGVAPCDVVMLGDRSYDISGAIANEVHPVGAQWGYGTRRELARAGCSEFCRNIAEFRRIHVDQYPLHFNEKEGRSVQCRESCDPGRDCAHAPASAPRSSRRQLGFDKIAPGYDKRKRPEVRGDKATKHAVNPQHAA